MVTIKTFKNSLKKRLSNLSVQSRKKRCGKYHQLPYESWDPYHHSSYLFCTRPPRLLVFFGTKGCWFPTDDVEDEGCDIACFPTSLFVLILNPGVKFFTIPGRLFIVIELFPFPPPLFWVPLLVAACCCSCSSLFGSLIFKCSLNDIQNSPIFTISPFFPEYKVRQFLQIEAYPLVSRMISPGESSFPGSSQIEQLIANKIV